MAQYRIGHVTDEDDLTAMLAGMIKAKLEGKIGGLNWSSSVVRDRRGEAAEEKRIGADMLIHVKLRTPALKYSKGVLVQAKRIDRGRQMTTVDHNNLIDQCNKMLKITPAAFVFDYMKGGMKCGSATRIAGSADRQLDRQCTITPFRFFYELFRCPTGDPRITSGLVAELPVPTVLTISANGEIELT